MKILQDLGMRYATPTSKKKVRFLQVECPTCLSPYEASAGSIHGGKSRQCKKCALNAIIKKSASARNLAAAKDFIAKSKQVHGNRYDYSKTNYISISIKVTITCKIHGDFEQGARAHLTGSGCPKCSGHYSPTPMEYINSVKDIAPDITVEEDYKTRSTKIKHKHICGHTWAVSPDHILSGCGCPKCSTNSDYDVFYIWNIPDTNIFKLGITSKRREHKRIHEVALELSKAAKIVINPLIRYCIATDDALQLEQLLLKTFTRKPLTIPNNINGYSEFRLINDDELLTLDKIIKEFND